MKVQDSSEYFCFNKTFFYELGLVSNSNLTVSIQMSTIL